MENKNQKGWLAHFIHEPVYLINDSVDPPDFLTEEVAEEENIPGINWYGNPGAGTGILVDYPQEEFLPDNERKLLTNILDAVGLNWKKAKLLNIAHLNADEKFNSPLELEVSSLIIFHIDPSRIFEGADWGVELYQPKQVFNVMVLSAGSLTHLQNDIQEKKKLWTSLKKMYGV